MKGDPGPTLLEGCVLKTCKNMLWVESLNNLVCCYEGKPYNPGSSLPILMSDDGCGAAHHQCVLQDDQAVLLLSVENRCSGYATQDQARELKYLVKEFMRTKC